MSLFKKPKSDGTPESQPLLTSKTNKSTYGTFNFAGEKNPDSCKIQAKTMDKRPPDVDDPSAGAGRGNRGVSMRTGS